MNVRVTMGISQRFPWNLPVCNRASMPKLIVKKIKGRQTWMAALFQNSDWKRVGVMEYKQSSMNPATDTAERNLTFGKNFLLTGSIAQDIAKNQETEINEGTKTEAL